MCEENYVPGTMVEQATAVRSHVLVVMSGGQDSTTCLGLALRYFQNVSAVCFSYGQKHVVETICARRICDKYNVPFTVMEMPMFSTIGDSALLAGGGDVNERHQRNAALPASFVPNRNAMFLTAAHALAQKIGASYLMTGVCQTDYSGYPDCREDFVKLLNLTLDSGSSSVVEILTPLMFINKAQTFELAEKVGFLDTVIGMSHTCYNGNHSTSHPWGHGCGTCPACELRKAGWEAYTEAKAKWLEP
ncbi:MAG: 7-cyano-7-deazaguanine synthase QueC [Aeromonas veronii]